MKISKERFSNLGSKAKELWAKLVKRLIIFLKEDNETSELHARNRT